MMNNVSEGIDYQQLLGKIFIQKCKNLGLETQIVEKFRDKIEILSILGKICIRLPAGILSKISSVCQLPAPPIF